MRCADCGVEIVHVRAGTWAEETSPGVWVTTCRSNIDLTGETARMVSADYHYVEGETQRHFEAQP